MRLIHDDCLNAMRGLSDGSVDAVIADPPYGTTACKWDSVIPFAPMWEQLRRVTKLNAAIVLFAAQPFTSALVMSNPKEYRHEWIWAKPQGTNPLNARVMPLKAHESVCVFGAGTPAYYPQMGVGKPYKGFMAQDDAAIGEVYGGLRSVHRENAGTRYPVTLLPFAQQRRGDHPTQKPVDLLAYLIRTYTNPGETVLDFCMGSGTTGVACIQEDRRFIGIEQDSTYYEISQRRIAAAQPPLLLTAD